jgi:hypothetical protein
VLGGLDADHLVLGRCPGELRARIGVLPLITGTSPVSVSNRSHHGQFPSARQLTNSLRLPVSLCHVFAAPDTCLRGPSPRRFSRPALASVEREALGHRADRAGPFVSDHFGVWALFEER